MVVFSALALVGLIAFAKYDLKKKGIIDNDKKDNEESKSGGN